jgi:hypothetical protein
VKPRLQIQLRWRLRAVQRALPARPLPGPRQIHQARQYTKQARAILRLLRHALKRSVFRDTDRDLRAVAASLSEARARTVILETLFALGAERAYMRPAIRAVEHSWQVHARGLAAQPLGREMNAALRPLQAAADRVEGWILPPESEQSVRKAVGRCYLKGRRAWKRALSTAAEDDWHNCRKHAKYLDYQLGCAVSLGAPLRSLRKGAHELGTLLGRAHDLADLRRAIHRSAAAHSSSGAAVLLNIAERESQLVRRAGKLAGHVFGQRARDFDRQLRTRAVRFIVPVADTRARAGSTTKRFGAGERGRPMR